MFKSYFKVGWRHLTRSTGFTLLNVLGLATGMSVAWLIGLWVHYQYSYDKFLPAYKQLYQVQRNFNDNGDTVTFTNTSLKLADALRAQVPEIEYVAESDLMESHGLMTGDKKIYTKGAQVGGDFLKMFQYPLLSGHVNTVFKDPYSIVLTQSTAKALFGNENPVGKLVRFDNKNDLKVTGILEDLPPASTLQFNFLVPFSYYEQTEYWVKEGRTADFSYNAFQQFVRLKPGAKYAQVAAKIKDMEKTETNNINAMNTDVILQPLQHWHLYSTYENGKEAGGMIQYVKMFGIIGLLVYLIACMNFINLTTARSEKRAKEVGVRKAIGSLRKHLIIQFLSETFSLSFIAFVISILATLSVLPAFNALSGTKIKIPFSMPLFWLVGIGSVFITTFIAGIVPALYLSSFTPVKVLKNNRQAGKAASLPRKILVVTQFSCSVALIISTIVIYKQIHYAKDRPIGYNINRIMVTDLNSDLAYRYRAIKSELLQNNIAESVSAASSPATDILWHSHIDDWPGKYPGETVAVATIQTAEDYFKTLHITVKAGRDFIMDADTSNAILNEAAVKRLRLTQPLDKIISWQGRTLRIIGVVNNALMISPFAHPEPILFLYHPSYENFLIYRLPPLTKMHEAIIKLTDVFNKYNPAFPYTYQFADQSYAAKFNLEVLIGKLAGLFAGLAIFISCLGLFGLAAYIAEQRTKEIGIRKVLGASVSQLWLLLSKEFILLVVLSCTIASPIAFYFLHNWLLGYAYRVRIGAEVFIAAAVLSVFITVITISFQSIKAAMANPVKSLRTE